MSIEEIYSKIREFITSRIVGAQQHAWRWAKMEVSIQPAGSSLNVSYDIEGAGIISALQSKEAWHQVGKLLKQLHQQTIEAGAAKWNKATIVVFADQRMETSFTFDQEWQDREDQFYRDNNEQIPKWEWEK